MDSDETFREWGRAAVELFPGLRTFIQEAENLHGVWIKLWLKLERAYDDPTDGAFIAEVHRFALWCLDSNNWRVREAVEIGFYEDIADSVFNDESRFRAKMRDVARYVTPERFRSLEKVFGYALHGYSWEKFQSDYDRAAREI
jgi:hypothetical protein